MTVSTTTSVASVIGNGVVTIIPFSFRFFEDDDLQVLQIDSATGIETMLVLGTDYSVQGAGTAAGGSVTLLLGPLAIGQIAVVARVLEMTQLVQIINQGKFFPEIHENVFDYLTMLIQQVSGQIDRAITFPFTDPDGVDRTLPAVAVRASKLLGFGPDGSPRVSGLTIEQLEASAVDAAASAAAALASENACAAIYDDFDDRYLGPKAANPATDNDGQPLIAGTLYFNTSAKEMRVWDGSVWLATASPNAVSGPGTATNNAVARFDLTTGKAIKSSLSTLADDGGMTVKSITSGFSPTPANNFIFESMGNGAMQVRRQSGEIVLTLGTAGDLDFAVVPINSGANLVTYTRYIVSNPFPGFNVLVTVEIQVGGVWANPSWNGFNGNAPIGSRGVFADQYGDNEIAVTTGGTYLAGNIQDGNPFPSSSITSAPGRVKVWKVKGKI